jgi:hypothetical protein
MYLYFSDIETSGL